MPIRKSKAVWNGDIKEGKGQINFGGRFEQPYSFGTRFEETPGTNPEELIGGALAGCFSMALSAGLGQSGFIPKSIRTEAQVTIEKVGEGFTITRIALQTIAEVPGADSAKFNEIAEATKKGCPVSRALAGTEITLDARLA
ncbi:MAG: OsmC family protein [Fibrobacteria bacterium]